MLNTNKIYNEDNRTGLLKLPEKCANLIIADPPYFEVKGEFDFVWKSFDEYLEFMEVQAQLYKRILAENGTLLVYGHSKRIAYVQVVFDKYFGLINNLVWEKAESDGLFGSTGSEQLRSFPNSTERILFYSNDVYNLTQCVYGVRDYIRNEILRARGKIVFKEINKALGTATNGGGFASACLSLNKAEPAMLTKEMYQKLQIWLNGKEEYEYLRKEYEDLRKEYEDLRKEYEDLRRPFNNITRSTEILKFRFKPTNYDHDTVKPEKLTRALILTCSRPGDLVVVPFVGSGTECAMAAKEKRKYIGFETESKYVEMARKRTKIQEGINTLF